MTRQYTDQQIIEAFRAGGDARNLAWEFAFKDWKSRVIGTIVQRGGTREEAMDAVQEAHGSFERRICQPDFVLQHRLSSYFITCVYRNWVGAKKGRKMDLAEFQDHHLSEFAESVESDIARGDLARVLDETLARLGERCHTILRLFMESFSMREIAEKMDFAGGEQVAKNEKRKCQERYETFLNENPAIKAYIQNLRHG
jgi:DNA-directed RNA polymerase specialized sigma24 family protein